MPPKRLALRALAVGAAVATFVALSGCSTVMPLLGLQAAPKDPGSNQAAADAANAVTDQSLKFASVFTDMGSVHPTTDITDGLELKLDVWTEQKTHDWYYDADKRFSFVIGVYDNRVAAEAPFDQKRRVYMSNITVTAKTSSASGTVETPYVLNTDPLKVTLDPEALRSDQGLGLLITSPKGGFQLESQQIGVVAPDTDGLMLDFAFQVSYETAPSSNAFTTQVVHQYVPVAIFAHTVSTSTPTPTPTPIPIG